MYGVLVDYGEDGYKAFKIFDNEQDAVGYNVTMTFLGHHSTLFEYDKDNNEFVEWNF